MDTIGGEFSDLVDFAVTVLPKNAKKVISGMASGWDQAIAVASNKRGIPWVAAVPFEGQASRWPQEHQDFYHDLLKSASEVVLVSDGGYAPEKHTLRDQWMVNNSSAVSALWSGVRKGGTWATVEYALRSDKPVLNFWAEWESRKVTALDDFRFVYEMNRWDTALCGVCTVHGETLFFNLHNDVSWNTDSSRIYYVYRFRDEVKNYFLMRQLMFEQQVGMHCTYGPDGNRLNIPYCRSKHTPEDLNEKGIPKFYDLPNPFSFRAELATAELVGKWVIPVELEDEE